MAYRQLGHRKVKLPRNTPGYWQAIDEMRRLRTSAEPLRISYNNETLALYDLTTLGYHVRCYSSAVGLAVSVR